MSKLFRGYNLIGASFGVHSNDVANETYYHSLCAGAEFYMTSVQMVFVSLKRENTDLFDKIKKSNPYKHFEAEVTSFAQKLSDLARSSKSFHEKAVAVEMFSQSLSRAGDALLASYAKLTGKNKPGITLTPKIDVDFPLMCDNKEAPPEVKKWLILQEPGVSNKTVFCRLPDVFYTMVKMYYTKKNVPEIAPVKPVDSSNVIFTPGLQLANGYVVEMVIDSFVCVARRGTIAFPMPFSAHGVLPSVLSAVVSISQTILTSVATKAVALTANIGNYVATSVLSKLNVLSDRRIGWLGIKYNKKLKSFEVSDKLKYLVGGAVVTVVAASAGCLLACFFPVASMTFTMLNGIFTVMAATLKVGISVVDPVSYAVPLMQLAYAITGWIVNKTGNKNIAYIHKMLGIVTGWLAVALQFWIFFRYVNDGFKLVSWVTSLSNFASIGSIFGFYAQNPSRTDTPLNNSTESSSNRLEGASDESLKNEETRTIGADLLTGPHARKTTSSVCTAVEFSTKSMSDEVFWEYCAAGKEYCDKIGLEVPKAALNLVSINGTVCGGAAMSDVEDVLFAEDVLTTLADNPEVKPSIEKTASSMRNGIESNSTDTENTTSSNSSTVDPSQVEESTAAGEEQVKQSSSFLSWLRSWTSLKSSTPPTAEQTANSTSTDAPPQNNATNPDTGPSLVGDPPSVNSASSSENAGDNSLQNVSSWWSKASAAAVGLFGVAAVVGSGGAAAPLLLGTALAGASTVRLASF